MYLRPRKLETVKEEGWHIVTSDWWHTLYDSMPWSFTQEYFVEDTAKRSSFRGSLFSWWDASCSSEASFRRRRNAFDGPEHDLTLSAELCGVQCAADAIATYEADVGFFPVGVVESQHCKGGRMVDISVEVNQEDVARGREKWNVFAEVLMSKVSQEPPVNVDDELAIGNETSRVSSPSSSSHGGLHRSTSTLSSVDLTDSDLSYNSISVPSTPRGKSIEAIVEVKDASPVTGGKEHYISPGRPLNASASSFVPTSITPSKAKAEESFMFATPTTTEPKPSSQPAFVSFTFPSLEVPPLPTVRIKKDEQGFYSEAEVAAPVPQTQRAACAFLPPFLQDSIRRKAPASKTRAMVDRLRSSHNHSHSPSPNPPLYDLNLFEERTSVSEDDRPRNSGMSSPSSQEEDDDGWINLAEADKASQESKARRTRNLFLALTRRRSDSVPPNQNTEANADTQSEIEIPMTTSPSPSPSPLLSTEDGWIEGPSVAPSTETTPQQRRTESRSRSHRKRRSSHAPPAPPTAIPPHFMPSTTLRAPIGLHHVPFHPAASHFPSPAPASYFYATYPAMMSPVAYTSYMQQLQLMQLQLRGSGGGGGGVGGRRSTAPHSAEWFTHPTAGVKSFTTANTPAPMVSSPAPLGRRGSLW
ncbi:hypothetical protein D9615_009170 [Tricholomella constricta]|uniref:Uncharacterized protein n=1 Tax=Tricholomella constricta TaxID=117010 RepID=A0A8H5H2J5_9AGAR|nr:hypothetical protein D9615_009170 [Tricholomella constricta]